MLVSLTTKDTKYINQPLPTPPHFDFIKIGGKLLPGKMKMLRKAIVVFPPYSGTAGMGRVMEGHFSTISWFARQSFAHFMRLDTELMFVYSIVQMSHNQRTGGSNGT